MCRRCFSSIIFNDTWKWLWYDAGRQRASGAKVNEAIDSNECSYSMLVLCVSVVSFVSINVSINHATNTQNAIESNCRTRRETDCRAQDDEKRRLKGCESEKCITDDGKTISSESDDERQIEFSCVCACVTDENEKLNCFRFRLKCHRCVIGYYGVNKFIGFF